MTGLFAWISLTAVSRTYIIIPVFVVATHSGRGGGCTRPYY